MEFLVKEYERIKVNFLRNEKSICSPTSSMWACVYYNFILIEYNSS